MGTVPVAVSMTTESSDHYLHLLHVISVEHFIEECKKWMGDELKYVYRHDVESNIPEFNKELKNALQAEIESRWED
jgi:hypothetical protein